MFVGDLSRQELLAALESLRAGRVLAALAEGALLVVLHDLGTTGGLSTCRSCQMASY